MRACMVVEVWRAKGTQITDTNTLLGEREREREREREQAKQFSQEERMICREMAFPVQSGKQYPNRLLALLRAKEVQTENKKTEPRNISELRE